MQDVVMPSLGEAIEEGKVLCWLKLVGEPVEKDDPLLEIETDKINAEMPAPVSGTVRAIFVAPGAKVQVGAVLALIGEVDEPLPDSLPGQTVEVMQRCSDSKKDEGQSSLVTIGWLSVTCASALLLAFQRAWPDGNWWGTGLIGLLLLSVGLFLGLPFRNGKAKE